MAYLSIARFSGDPARLLDVYRRTSETMAQVGSDHGLRVHAAGPTEDGFVIVNLWPSSAGSRAAAADPRRLAVLRDHDLDLSRVHREHHELESLVLFG